MMTTERRSGWIYAAHTLDKLGRTQDARDLLLSVAADFEPDWTIPYHLARIYARLEQPFEAEEWFGRALLAASSLKEVKRLRDLALQDPDIKRLREAALSRAV